MRREYRRPLFLCLAVLFTVAVALKHAKRPHFEILRGGVVLVLRRLFAFVASSLQLFGKFLAGSLI